MYTMNDSSQNAIPAQPWSEHSSGRKCSLASKVGAGILALVFAKAMMVVAKKLREEAIRRQDQRALDARLDEAIEETMDCSDPITKY